MNALKDIQHFYFIGIGGIGMSALAFYFHETGKQVAGYDKTPSDVTRSLEEKGIPVHFNDKGPEVDAPYQIDNTLVIYTPAVPSNFGELVRFRESGYTIKKRAEVLGMIANAHYSLAVAGTHGKTTTSSILGHLLAETGAPVTAFIGGITNNYKGNLIQKGNDVIVVEADEFDRSFLQLTPDIACITSMDADHLDIYGDAATLENTFKEFGSLVSKEKLFVQNGLPIDGLTVGIEDDAMYSAQNVVVKNGCYHFDFKHPDGVISQMQFNLPGRHNLSNAITALGMAMLYGSPTELLPKALLSFSGVNRRFTYRIQTENQVLIDDYAHHPTEINALHQAVREMYPAKKVTAIFQPHLFSRTKDFADEFAESLAQFDEISLLEIYPAREKPMEGITSSWLLSKIKNDQKQLIAKENLINYIKEINTDVLLTVGAGDIGAEVLKIKNALTVES